MIVQIILNTNKQRKIYSHKLEDEMLLVEDEEGNSRISTKIDKVY